MTTLQKSLCIFKPDILHNGYSEQALDRIIKAGFTIVDWKVLQLDEYTAREFYQEHTGKPFFDGLIKYMTSGPIRVMVLAKEDAIHAWRDLIGPTNCEVAKVKAPNSLRALYGRGPTENGFHGSDSPITAKKEIIFFFHNQRVDNGDAGESSQEYLQRVINPLLMKGLTTLCKEKPTEPIVYLANWLLEHNPNKPTIVEPPPTAAHAAAVTASSPGSAGIKRKYRTKKDIIFVLGGPGSGKGTQCQRLADEFNLLHLSAGDLLRSEVASGSTEGKMVDQMIKEGKLVPYEVTIRLLAKAIIASDKRVVLVDGFPRAIDQLEAFEGMVKPCKYTLFFDCSEDVMRSRIMKRGETSLRTDDNPEAITKRLKTYSDQTVPVVKRMEQVGKLIKISAEPSIESVYKHVRQLFV